MITKQRKEQILDSYVTELVKRVKKLNIEDFDSPDKVVEKAMEELANEKAFFDKLQRLNKN